jgi:two-component system sensor histidine kinase AlgZ
MVTRWMGGSALDADLLRSAVLALMVTAALLFYFNWRHHRQSPAWAESRLMALQSRIRPHFLFNSLNSVLALIRSEPRKAEAMLEDLAELFRALLAEPRTLVPLAEELALARSYVAIEGIRLGERLRVHWQCDAALDDALVPPLLLQPLLENAVRYGAEPLEQGADIAVEVGREGNYLVLTVRNPCPAAGQALVGNRMALANIAERLSLHFDAEAQLKTNVAEGEHIARVRLPITRVKR